MHSPAPRLPEPASPQIPLRSTPGPVIRSNGPLVPTWGRIVVLAVLFAIFVFVVALMIDYTLLIHKDSPWATVEVSDALAGLLAGALFLKLLQLYRAQRVRLAQRLQVIDEMNDHIRNALQMISFTVHATPENENEVANIDRAVGKIQWALNEILPKI